jgi:hypothetical protein
MLRRVALVGTDVSEERIASIIRVTIIAEVWKTLSITNDYQLTSFLARWFVPLWWCRPYLSPKRLFLQEPHGITSQKLAFLLGLIHCTWLIPETGAVYGVLYVYCMVLVDDRASIGRFSTNHNQRAPGTIIWTDKFYTSTGFGTPRNGRYRLHQEPLSKNL